MTPLEELNYLMREQKRVVEEVASDLLSELIGITPEKTGQLKGGWDLEETSNGWILSNNLIYASVIFDGRRNVGGQWYGSESLADGLTPTLKKYNIILQDKLDRIKVK
jgi:hypothetical protein